MSKILSAKTIAVILVISCLTACNNTGAASNASTETAASTETTDSTNDRQAGLAVGEVTCAYTKGIPDDTKRAIRLPGRGI